MRGAGFMSLELWVYAVHALAVLGSFVIIRWIWLIVDTTNFLQLVFNVLKSLPYIRGIVLREKRSAQRSISDMIQEKVHIPGIPVFSELPERGLTGPEIMTLVDEIKKSEAAHTTGRAFGGIYYPPEHDGS